MSFKAAHYLSDAQSHPGEIKRREVELGCHGELDYLLLQVSTVAFRILVFVTLFRTAVETFWIWACYVSVDIQIF